MVWVGPPLSWRGPSIGSVLLRSPGPLKLHLLSLLRLYPFEVSVPSQFPPELFATMLFCRVVVAVPKMPPPEPAELFARVLLLMVILPIGLLKTPPPLWPPAPLSLTVLFTIRTDP